MEDRVGIRRGRAVGAFTKDSGLHFGGVFFRNLPFHGAREEDIDLHGQEFLVRDFAGSLEADHGMVLAPGRVFRQFVRIDALFVANGAKDIGDGHHFQARIIG